MKISKSRIRQLIRESIKKTILSEQDIGWGNYWDYDDKGSVAELASQKPVGLQVFLSLTSIIDPTMASDIASAGLYALEGDTDSAADVILWSAGGFGAGPFLVALSKWWKSLGKSADEIADMTDAINASIKNRKPPESPPDVHPEIFKKAEVNRQPTYVINIKGKMRQTSIVDEAYNMTVMKKIIPDHVPDVVGFGGERGSRILELSKIDSPSHFDSFTGPYMEKMLDGIKVTNEERKNLQKVKSQIEEIQSSFSSHGFTHRDLNSGNLVIDNKGKVWVIDPIGLQKGEKLTNGMISDAEYFNDYIDTLEMLLK